MCTCAQQIGVSVGTEGITERLVSYPVAGWIPSKLPMLPHWAFYRVCVCVCRVESEG